MYRMLLLIATLMMGVQAAYADVRIGILMPLTGAGSRYGQEQRVAIDMFLEKYSDLGGAAGKLVPIIYDTRWSGTEAISVDAQAHRFRSSRSHRRTHVKQ